MTTPTRPDIAAIKERCREIAVPLDGSPLEQSELDRVACVEWIEHLERELAEIQDIDIARQQFPDGTVPGNTVECARGWKKWAEHFDSTLRRRITDLENERDTAKQKLAELEKDRERLIDGMASKLVDAASAVKKGEK